MGIIDIPRKWKKGHRNSNSRGGEGSNYSKKSQVLISPTHQPLQLLTAELAQKDISPGHSQFFQPAGNWTRPTDQKGAIGLGVIGFMMKITKMFRWRKSPIPILLLPSPYPQCVTPDCPGHSCISPISAIPFHQFILLSSIPLIPNNHMKGHLRWP